MPQRRYSERRKPEYATKKPNRLEAGVVINHVRVLHVHRQHSVFYDQTHTYYVNRSGVQVPRSNSFEHMTGEVDCECLMCGRLFTAKSRHLAPNRPERSLWTCGCQRRPGGTGYRTKDAQMGRPPEDLTDQLFGVLEPISYISYWGWLCLCHRCGNTDGCVVASRLLARGRITACADCKPWEWGPLRGNTRRMNHMIERGEMEPLPVPAIRDSSKVLPPAEELKVVVDWNEALDAFKKWNERAKVRGQSLTGD